MSSLGHVVISIQNKYSLKLGNNLDDWLEIFLGTHDQLTKEGQQILHIVKSWNVLV